MSQAPVHAETRSPLADPAWRYIEKPSIEAFSAEDWAVMARQRREFAAAKQADIVLAMLRVGEDEPTFGYQINNFRHCLQSASRVLRAGLDEETVAVALLHDIGFTACPATHGDFAAALLQPYIGARNHWMLEHHQIFQDAHSPTHPDADPQAREPFRGHPHFAWTAEYVARFDQDAIRPDEDVLPLEPFIPIIRRLFARPPTARQNAAWRSG
jgi:predicted HD phosphohydrolase